MSGRRPQLFSRIMWAWAVGSGVPLLSIALAVVVRDGPQLPSDLPVLYLTLVGVVFGAFMTAFTARSIARPLKDVREAVTSVSEGELDVAVPVDDPTELGMLQAGINRMTAGLRERQKLQDLFGRQVGEDVARQALERGVQLGGEEREVAVLFVDVVGSTQLAVDRPAGEVVELLNSFFTAVVDVVGDNGGFVNKFQGDAALAVFGAPVPRPDSAACALLSARELRTRLSQVKDLSAGIGVSAGSVVAGNVGAAQRFEYTVIGDAVNEASRLTELAKQTEHGVLASGRAVQDAGEAEQGYWRKLGSVRLRGRTRESTVYGPSRSEVWEEL
jgi:adenylate cyclase